MKRLFSLLLVSGFMFSFAEVKNPDGTKLEPRRTVIAGVVENYTDDMDILTVDFRNFFSDKIEFVQNLAESGGYFQTEHDYLLPQELFIMLGDKDILMFVSPGDSIFINIDAAKMSSDFCNSIRFSGDNAIMNNEIASWKNYSSRLKSSLRVDYNIPSDRFLASIRQTFGAVKDSIDAYAQRKNLDDTFKKWAFIDFKFNLEARNYNHDNADKWAVMTDPVFDVYNVDNFQSMMFPYHFYASTVSLMRSDVELSNLLAKQENVRFFRLLIKRLHEKAPEGIVRDAMLSAILKEALRPMPYLYDSLPEIRSAFSDDLFIEELEKIANKRNVITKLSSDERILNGILYLNGSETVELSESGLLNYLSEKYKDKVVYIDVWATWCVYCIEEMKDCAPDLHKHFEGNDVVFVNLCLNSDTEDWMQIVRTDNIGGENYFLGGNASKLFMGDNNLPGFPSYLIIDKEGKLHNPVPRPSELAEAIKKIESLLK